jgi:hypothetical protein
MQQHKLEIKGKTFFIRGYTTSEDGGKPYDMLFTGININRVWKMIKLGWAIMQLLMLQLLQIRSTQKMPILQQKMLS